MDQEVTEPVEDIKFEDIEKILQELTDTLSMAQRRTTLLGKRLRIEVDEEDMKAALAQIQALEKSYLELPCQQQQEQCWFEYVTLQAQETEATQAS